MEAVLTLGSRQLQLFLHDLLRRIVRQLEIVCTGHHAGQVVIWIHLEYLKLSNQFYSVLSATMCKGDLRVFFVFVFLRGLTIVSAWKIAVSMILCNGRPGHSA